MIFTGGEKKITILSHHYGDQYLI